MLIDRVPEEYRYTRNHTWIKMEDDFIAVCGITSRALDFVSDIVFADLPDTNADYKQDEQAARLQSSIADLDINAPVSGIVTAVNYELETSPELITLDPFGRGWIFKIDVRYTTEYENLMDSERYMEYLESC